jgi:hypothetical protein
MTTNQSLNAAYLVDIVRTFRNYKSLGDRALAQTADADLNVLIDPEANSIALIIKHLSGNLKSRFTDFLTTDGEKPDRDRDAEFEMPRQARAKKSSAGGKTPGRSRWRPSNRSVPRIWTAQSRFAASRFS